METIGAHKFPPLPPVAWKTTLETERWKHEMRREMQEIVPGVFLGPLASACRNSLENMLAAGLTHVVWARAPMNTIRPFHTEHFKYLVVDVDMQDPPTVSFIPKVKEVSAFIDSCLMSGGKVLVYGMTGMTFSAGLVVGYIMAKYGTTYKEAHEYVQSKRGCVWIYSTVIEYQLQSYESIYQAELLRLRLDNTEKFRSKKKRTMEVDEDDKKGNHQYKFYCHSEDEGEDNNEMETGE